VIPSRLLALFLTAAIVPAATVAACGGRSVDFRALGSADGGPGDSDSDKALDAPSDASAGDGACLEAPEEPPGAHGSLDVSFADGGALTFPQNGNEVMDQMCVFGLPGDGAIVIGRSVTEGIGVIYVGGYRVAATGAITASWSVPYQDLVACGQAPDGTVFIAGRSTAAGTNHDDALRRGRFAGHRVRYCVAAVHSCGDRGERKR